MTNQWIAVTPHQPPGEYVDLGEVLRDVAAACNDVAVNLSPSSLITDAAPAFMRLGGSFAAAALALNHVKVFVPKEESKDGG